MLFVLHTYRNHSIVCALVMPTIDGSIYNSCNFTFVRFSHLLSILLSSNIFRKTFRWQITFLIKFFYYPDFTYYSNCWETCIFNFLDIILLYTSLLSAYRHLFPDVKRAWISYSIPMFFENMVPRYLTYSTSSNLYILFSSIFTC